MLFRSDRKSTRLNSSHTIISYAVFCLKKKKKPLHSPKHSQLAYNTCALNTLSSSTHYYSALTHTLCRLFSAATSIFFFFFFFNDTATTEIYTLSLHDALPILSASKDGEKVEEAQATGLSY